MLFFIGQYSEANLNRLYLNTSHVILYRELKEKGILGHIFKYISCYSLSMERGGWQTDNVNLNTSHVILYLSSSCSYPVFFPDLNTSHVILYRQRPGRPALAGSPI